MRVLEKANPNRHGMVKLMEEGGFFYVREPGMDDLVEYEAYTHAKRHYDDAIKDLSGTPNWEAQAEYDAAHGTINGYSEWQFSREF